MMEGGGWSFGGERQRTPETPERILRELARDELWEIRRSSENPLSVAIAEKALQKMDIKEKDVVTSILTPNHSKITSVEKVVEIN